MISDVVGIGYSDGPRDHRDCRICMTAQFRTVAVFLVAAALLTAVIGVVKRRSSPRGTQVLEIEMRTAAGAFAQLFWSDDLRFTEDRSIRLPLERTPNGFQRLRFITPRRGARWLRFDPSDALGDVVIHSARILDSTGQVLRQLDAGRFQPANQIESVSGPPGDTRIVTSPPGDDPSLYIPPGCSSSVRVTDDFELVTPATVSLASIAAVVLLAVSVWMVGASAVTQKTQDPAPEPRRQRSRVWLWPCALFLLVFSTKLLLIGEYPLTAPYLDQWDAEARAVYSPFGNCGLLWRDMFNLHNEHRVFFTRLLGLALLLVNHQWDPRLQQVVNAGLHSLTAVLIAFTFWVASGRRWLGLILFTVAVTCTLPFSWENTLQGFQSAFYFELLFSLLALWLTTTSRAGSLAWCLGWTCALCSLVTAAGGVVVPFAIAGVVALRLWNRPPDWRNVTMTLAVAAGVLALGVAIASPPLAHHAALRARTLVEFVGALGRNLAWPWVNHPLLSVVLWMPAAVLFAMHLHRTAGTTVLDQWIVGLGLWVAMQTVAVAYGRGAGAPPPQPRYQDFLSLGFVANTMAIAAGIDLTRPGGVGRRIAVGALAGWLLTSAVGMARLTDAAVLDLREWRSRWRAQALNVRRFVMTDDASAVAAGRPPDFPYPDARILITVLRDPYVRRILPPSTRAPVPVEPRSITDTTFVRGGTPPIVLADPLARVWGTYSSQGSLAEGRFESETVQPCELGGRLRFSVAGYLGLPGESLAILSIGPSRDTQIKPPTPAQERWADVDVPCPAGAYRLVAEDARPDYWFAFQEPVEVGRWSSVAELLIAHAFQFFVVAVAIVALVMRCL